MAVPLMAKVKSWYNAQMAPIWPDPLFGKYFHIQPVHSKRYTNLLRISLLWWTMEYTWVACVCSQGICVQQLEEYY